MENSLEHIYGRGWAFPPRFTLADGACMVAGAEDVRQSLIILFSTLPGERVMRDTYGCDLNQYMFANISSTLMTEIDAEIADSVLAWETRAEIARIDIGQDPLDLNVLRIELSYYLRGSDLSARLGAQLDLGDGVSTIQ